jgi:hypothetical protein
MMPVLNDSEIRFIYVKKKNRNVLYYDKNNQSVPFVVIAIEKMRHHITPIQTTRDLMEVEAHLFSNEKIALIFMTKYEGE